MHYIQWQTVYLTNTLYTLTQHKYMHFIHWHIQNTNMGILFTYRYNTNTVLYTLILVNAILHYQSFSPISIMLLVTVVIFWCLFWEQSHCWKDLLWCCVPASSLHHVGIADLFFLILVSCGLTAYTQNLSSVRASPQFSRWENKTGEIRDLSSNQLQLFHLNIHQHNASGKL